MSSFFSSKPQIRQEGFHLPPSNPSPPPFDFLNTNNDQAMSAHQPGFMPDAFRKYPGPGEPGSSMDFTDELASLMAHSPVSPHPHHQQQPSQERSTQSPPDDRPSTSNNQAYDDPYRSPTHPIFDVPPHSHQQHPSSSTATTSSSSFPPPFSIPPSSMQSQSSSLHTPSHLHTDFHHTQFAPPTLPPLTNPPNYPPPPPAQHQHQQHPHPPSSFPSHFSRHTPSPTTTSRSRSRSRAPSAGPGPGPGPQRTTRSRRNNSVSSTSPPPLPRPQAIVIPGHRTINGVNGTHGQPVSPLSLHSLSAGGAPTGTTSSWFIPSHSAHSQNDYLPSPDSIQHSHPHPHSQYASFNLSPTDTLPPQLPSSLPSLHHHPSSLHNHPHLTDDYQDSPTVPPASVHDPSTKQALLANEKRRRRRESHNAVERRRRDNINEKISELATLIPECMLDPGAPGTPLPTPIEGDPFLSSLLPASSAEVAKKEEKDDASGGAGEGGVVKANKGMILRKSVEYIRYLQQLVTAQATRNRELEQQLASVRSSSSVRAGSGGREKVGGGGGVVGEDEMGMMLHEDVGSFGGVMQFGMVSNFGGGGGSGSGGGGVVGKGMFELGTMREGEGDDLEMEEGEGRVSVGMSPNPSLESEGGGGGGGGDGDGGEEERGRRGRDGRVRDLEGEEGGVSKDEEGKEGGRRSSMETS